MKAGDSMKEVIDEWRPNDFQQTLAQHRIISDVIREAISPDRHRMNI